MVDVKDINRYIDHTLLKPDAGQHEIEKLCEEAVKYGFAAVCVNPAFVSFVSRLLKGSGVKVCTVIGFPLGATTFRVKAYETAEAIQNGAEEIDMVINLGALKDGRDQEVTDDIRAVVQSAKGQPVKVIIETGLLTDEEKIRACRLVQQAGAQFVKTSTGFGPGGASVYDIMLMKDAVRGKLGIKASGGIRDKTTLLQMVEAGATRIGTSSGVKIMEE